MPDAALQATAKAVSAGTLEAAQMASLEAAGALNRAIAGLTAVVEQDRVCRAELVSLKEAADEAARKAAEDAKRAEEEAKIQREEERKRRDDERRDKLRKAREAASSKGMQSDARPRIEDQNAK